jgi:hypothetical protein
MRRSTKMPRSFSDDAPVLLNGLRVTFDHKVALYPVNLQEKQEKPSGAGGN